MQFTIPHELTELVSRSAQMLIVAGVGYIANKVRSFDTRQQAVETMLKGQDGVPGLVATVNKINETVQRHEIEHVRVDGEVKQLRSDVTRLEKEAA
jgi:hypothetical protein